MCSRLWLAVSLAACVVACKPAAQKQPAATDDTDDKPVPVVGVYASDFVCDSLITPDQLLALVGGTKVHVVTSAMSTPRGVPSPCNYVVEQPLPPPPPPSAKPAKQNGSGAGSAAPPAPPPHAWTFDLDCRDGAKDLFDRLYAQYARTSRAIVDSYNAAADAGQIKPDDAGYVQAAPSDSADVAVGARALDHHGQGLLFWDDDAPCYVRVVGPGAPARLALAKTLANRLTPKNAPTGPRPAN